MKTGVHTSVRKGFVGALKEALDLGCTAFQMFTQNPRGWKTRVYTSHDFDGFKKEREAAGIGPVVVHSPYLPNLCTSDLELYKKSLDTLTADLDRCEKLGAEFLVIHPGAFSPEANYQTGLAQITKALNKALSSVPGRSRICIENMAGGGRRLGGRFQELREMLSGVNDSDRIGICFDTCHAFAAGYDLSQPSGIDKTLDEFEEKIGLDKIYVFHVNDSKGELGGMRDLHQHLGKGKIGLSGFESFLKTSQFKKCTFILETPKEPPGADLENLKVLRQCLGK